MIHTTKREHRAGWIRQATRWTLVAIGAVLLVALIQVVAGSQTSADTGDESEHAHVDAVEGSDLSRVRLSARAAERLEIRTAPVRDARTPRGTKRMIVPYSALLYDADGETWVYTNPERLVFVRARVEVDAIERERAFVSVGPPAGTTVVTVGAAELFGAEFEVDH